MFDVNDLLYWTIAGVIIFILLVLRLLRKAQRRQSTDIIDEIYSSSQYRNRKDQPHIPHNDFKARNKLLEEKRKKELEEAGVMVYQPAKLMEEQVEVVDVVKPIGFWTKFIMGQKIGFIMSRIGAAKRGGGRWVNYILAQSASQGKDQTRGR